MAAPLASPIKKKAKQVVLDEPNMRNILFLKFPKVFVPPPNTRGYQWKFNMLQHLDKTRWCLNANDCDYYQIDLQPAYTVLGDFILIALTRQKKKAHDDQFHRNPTSQKGTYQFTFVSNPQDPTKDTPYKELGTQSGPMPGYKIIVCGRLGTDKDKSFTCLGEVKPVYDTAYSYYQTKIDPTDGKKRHFYRFQMCDVPYPAPQNVEQFICSLLD